MNTTTENYVIELVQQAVDYGVSALNGQKNAMALQIAHFWLDGVIAASTCYDEDDIKSIRATLDNYFFV